MVSSTSLGLTTGALHHALLESFAICLIISITIISIIHYYLQRDITVPIIGFALLSSGIIDGFHTLIATHLISSVTASEDIIPFTWAVSRLFNGAVMLLAAMVSFWLFKHVKVQRLKSQILLTSTFAISFIFLALAVIFLITLTTEFPQTTFPDAFITRPYDILPLALFVCLAAFYWLWYNQKSSVFRFSLLLSVVPAAATQFYMAVGASALFDNNFNIAHFLKIVAYSTLFIGFLIDLIYDNRPQHAEIETSESEVLQPISAKVSKALVNIGKVKWPLSFKIPLIGFLFSLIVALIISVTFYIESAQVVKEQEMSELTVEAKIVTSLFNDFYRQGARDVSFISSVQPIRGLIEGTRFNDDEMQAFWQGRLTSVLVDLLKTKPNYKKVSFISFSPTVDVIASAIRGNKGVESLSSDQLQKDINLSALKAVKSYTKSQAFYSDILFEKNKESRDLTSNASFFIAKPIFDHKTKEIFGLVGIELDLSKYLNTLKKQSLSNLSFYVADQKGQFISYFNKGQSQQQSLLMQDEFSVLKQYFDQQSNQAKIYHFRSESAENSLAFYSKIDFSNADVIERLIQQSTIIPTIHLVIENHNDKYITAIQNMRSRTIIMSLSLALLSLVISIFAARRVTKPLSKMTKCIAEYERTNKIGRLPMKEKDEIGLLARSFHNLFVTIDQNSSELKAKAREANSATVKLQAILNSIADAVITIDEKGTILAFNKAATNIFGYQEDEIINEPISKLMPVEIAQKLEASLFIYIKNPNEDNVSGREFPALRKDGETFPMQISISEVVTPEGRLFTGLVRDITSLKILDAEKKRILKEAKNAAWRLNFALSAPKIGVWDLDLTTKHLSWDDRMYQIFDEAPDTSLTPQHIWANAIHKEDEEQVYANISQTIKTKKVVHYQHRIMLKDDQIKHIEAHAQAILDENGNKVRIVGTYKDNTEQHQLQFLKQQALDMAEESLRLKSEFLASMSHEIRTPMNGVLGMLGLLEHSELTKQQYHHLQLANSSAHSLLSLINDILDFSKIEAGKLDLEILDFDIRSQLGEFAESMAVRAQEKSLELILDLTQVNYSMVKGDPSRLRQILSNLVGNAIKFTNSGEIVIKASLEDNGDQFTLTCEISDTGIGIPSDKITQLFDSFTQVDATTTRKYGGTGLGLAIVKQLSELMGGTVSVESRLNQGSCFTFNISLEKSDQSRLVMPSVSIEGTEILIVDDNTTNLEVLKGQLEIWGAIVTQAEDGYEALSIVEKSSKNKFSVAILDMQMPGMNGATLGKSLAEHENTSNTKMIMMTSMSERGDAAFFAKLGFSAYFPKPATTSDLFDALTVVLDNSEALNSAQPIGYASPFTQFTKT